MNAYGVLDSSLHGIVKLASFTTLPTILDLYGQPDVLLTHSRKPALVEIMKQHGVRGCNRLKKFSLVAMIWLRIGNTNYAELLDFINSHTGERGDREVAIWFDKLRYTIHYILSARWDEIQQAIQQDPLARDYALNLNRSFHNQNPKKIIFSLLYYYHLGYINFVHHARNTNTRSMSPTAYASLVQSAAIRVGNILNNAGIQSPSVTQRPIPRGRNSRRLPCTTPSVVTEKIPEHIKVEYKMMYSELWNIRKERKLESFSSHECPICMEEIDAESMVITNCGHHFHQECFNKIRTNSCPTCRKQIH